VGALNGLMIASHDIGQEKKAAQELTELWANIKSNNIMQQWAFPGLVQGLYSKPSFFDNSPELGFLQYKFKHYGGKVKRAYTIGIVDAQTGDYLSVNQQIDNSKIPYYIVASSSVPGIFRYIKDGKYVFIDGGTVNNLNLRNGIAECHKLGFEDYQITIDVIMTNPLDAHPYNMTGSKTYDIYHRSHELSKVAQAGYYLLDTMRVYPRIYWRYAIIPKKPLPNYPGIALVFYILLLN